MLLNFRKTIFTLFAFIAATAVSADDFYVKVNSVDEIVDGGQYLLVYEQTKFQATRNRVVVSFSGSSFTTDQCYDQGDGKNLIVQNNNALPLIIRKTNEGYTIQFADGDYLACASSDLKKGGTSDSYLWDIDIRDQDQYLLKRVYIHSKSYSRLIRYSSGSVKSESSKTTTSLCLYRKLYTTGTAVAQDENGDYYTTYSNDRNVFLPASQATAYTVTANGSRLTLTPLPLGNMNIDGNEVAGAYIPKNTGVLTRSNGTDLRFYDADFVNVAPLANNDLQPGTGVAPENDSNYKYYMLAYADEQLIPSTLGFYWGAEDGVAFASRKGGAYLRVPREAVPASARGFSISFDNDAAAIHDVEQSSAKASQAYNIIGQRISTTKGIVIINGKKYIRK